MTPIDDELLDRTLGRAIDAALEQGLMHCRPATPLPAQVRIAREAIRRAEGAGLHLPPRICIKWRDGKPDHSTGAARRVGEDYEMFLSVNLFPDVLQQTTWHEAQHLADFYAGIRCTRLELERRAIAFANAMMAATYGV